MQSNNYKIKNDICEYIRALVAPTVIYKTSYSTCDRIWEVTNNTIPNILFEIYEAVVYDV